MHRYQVAHLYLNGQHKHWNSAGTEQTHAWIFTAVFLLDKERRWCCCNWGQQCNITDVTWRATKHYTEQLFFWFKQAALRPFFSSFAPEAAEDANLKGVSSSHQFGQIWNINFFVSEKDKGGDTAGSNEWVGRATRQAAKRCYLWEQCQWMNAVHHVLLKVVLTTTFCNISCAKLTPWLRTSSTSAVQKEESEPPSLIFLYIYI